MVLALVAYGCAPTLSAIPAGRISGLAALPIAGDEPVLSARATNAAAALGAAVDDPSPTGCLGLDQARATEANRLSLEVWHADFWPTTIGVLGSFSGALLLTISAAYESDMTMPSGTADDLQVAAGVVAGITGATTAAIVAIIAATQVHASGARARAAFQLVDGVRERAILAYPALDQSIRAAATRAAALPVADPRRTTELDEVRAGVGALEQLVVLTRASCR